VHAWRDADGQALAELRLDEPLPFVHGDRFVLRDEAARHTLGGGRVLDPAPPVRGLMRADYQPQLAVLRASTPAGALAHAASNGTVVGVAAFRRAWNLPDAAMPALLAGADMQAITRGPDALAITASALANHTQAIAETVEAWHKANAHVRGIRPDQLRAVLRARMPPALVAPVCEHMVETGTLQRAAGFLQKPGHAPRISADDRALWSRLEPIVSSDVRPPVLHDIARRLPMDIDQLRTAVRRLAFAGLVVQVADNRVFAAPQVEQLMQVARDLDREADGDGFLATRFRDETNLGRNLAIDVLEHFDSTGFTVRRGDRRIVSRIQHARGGRAAGGTAGGSSGSGGRV
jgi:selenocysteine-specific elongation factor